jgi:hypothetical protein
MACAERSKSMKRTLTAAATLLVGTAGTAGFAGAAGADVPQSRFNVANNTSADELVHSTTGTLHHHENEQNLAHHFFGVPYYGSRMVGEVFPLTSPVINKVGQKLAPPPEAASPRIADAPPINQEAQGEAGLPGQPGMADVPESPDQAIGMVADASKPAQQLASDITGGGSPLNSVSPQGRSNAVSSNPVSEVLGKGNPVENVAHAVPHDISTGSMSNHELDGLDGHAGQSVVG